MRIQDEGDDCNVVSLLIILLNARNEHSENYFSTIMLPFNEKRDVTFQ
jgi:hypothetical protein